MAFGEFAAGLQPALASHIKLVAIGCVGTLTLLNFVGLRSGSRTQELTSPIKALALIAFVGACFIVSPKSSALPVSSFPASSESMILAMVIALQSIIATYDGWYCAIYFMEEDKDPARNLPRSAISSTSHVSQSSYW